MGVSEMKWTRLGNFTSDEYEVYYSGQEALRKNGAAFICTDEMRIRVLGFNPVSDRIVTIRLQGKPVNVTVIQTYAPTSTAEEEDVEDLYEMLHKLIAENPGGDVMYVIGDWNAKVGEEQTDGITGRYGLGARDDRGDTLVEFWGPLH